ncbi:MAG: DUF262 domain-containing HNH endonuclease family protein [Candidatus Poribacteria bacterium]|nr:DUF262 domain-containing HNH endonuclease family protein [Candidatus Poribacteria bacterium]
MENGQKRISELFDGRKIFNIPKYQRAYAWEEQQLKDFVEDIENQKPDRSYFFGTILFQAQPRHEGFEVIDIVDGQQRITTLIIFMKLLLTQRKETGNDVTMLEDTYIQIYNRYKLRVLDTDNDFFISYILQDNRPDVSQIHTPSQRRLLKAKNFLCRSLKTRSDKIEKFIDTIENMKVLTYSVEDKAEATLIFETTNDRGKSLTSLEKTKSFLMHKSYIVSNNPETDLDILQDRFSEIYRNYEEIESRVDEDSILQYHFIAFEEWKNKKEYQQSVQMIKQKVNKLVNAEDRAEAWRFIERCSRELKESFGIVKTLFTSRAPYLLDLFALSRRATFYPLLIKAYKLDRLDGKQNFKRITRLVEIICFRFGIGGYRSDKGRESLYGLARDFSGNFDQLVKELQDFVEYYCNDSEFERCLRNSFFHFDVDGNDQQYLFWKYENHLRIKKQPIFPEMSYDEFTNTDSRRKFSIEHIIPQYPTANEIVADKSIRPTIDLNFRAKYLHSIGNLTIDPLSANASKSNQDFEHKDQGYFRKAPLKTQNELSEFLNSETERWDEVSISNRADRILKFALGHWDHNSV